MSKRMQRVLVDKSGRFVRHHTPLSLAIAAALALPGLAAAQEAAPPAEELEEVVVTGFRQSLISSIEVKREAMSVVEAVSAEDIGKLPDTSIAESLARLPGLAGQRVNGRTSAISIRGFGEDFTAASMNGRELLGMGDNRGVEFDLYPSEILSGVTVYKTPTATLMTQGIAGTVDLRTVRPLESQQVINLQGSYEANEYDALNPDMDDTGYRFAGSYVDQFFGDTLGVALTVASMESPSQEEWFGAWGDSNYPRTDAGDIVLGGVKPYARSSTLSRDSVAGVLEWKPTDQLRVTADALYIDYLDEQVKRGLETPGYWGGPTTTIGTVEDGFVTSGTFAPRAPQIRNDSFEQDADLQVFGLNLEYQLTDTWSLMFDGAYNKVEKTLTDIEIYSSVGGRSGSPGQQFDTIGFEMTKRGAILDYNLPYDDYNQVYLAGAQCWGGGNPFSPSCDDQDGFTNIADFEEDLTTLRLQATKEFEGPFTSLQFGVNYADREKSKINNGYFLVSPAYPGAELVPEKFRNGTVALDFLGGQRMVAIDGRRLYRSGYYTEVSEGETKADRAADTYTITEKVTTGYAQLNFDTDYDGVRVSGNLGLQYVDSDQSADGFDAVGANVNGQPAVVAQAVSYSHDYGDWLPSFNLALGFTDDLTVRLGASRTMTRTRLDRLKPGSSIVFNYGNNQPGADISRSPWSANAGDPYLEPIKVDQYDLAVEYYFAPDGYVAASYFMKNLVNWQTSGSIPMDFTQYYYPGLIPAGDPNLVNCPPDGVCTYDGYRNLTLETQGGTIDGVEFQGALPFNIFADVLDGFGLLGYYQTLENKLTINGQEAQVVGLSDRSWGLTAYFEKWGFQARVSTSYRSDYAAEYRGLSNSLGVTQVLETELLDAQVSYDFGQAGFDGWLGGLMIFASGQNLTDEPYKEFFQNDTRQVKRYSSYGSTYQLGLRYRF
jgi:iron complex outermembrane recepter protein